MAVATDLLDLLSGNVRKGPSKAHIATNLGGADRLLRTGLGAFLLWNGASSRREGGTLWATMQGVLGAVLLYDGLSGTDPLLRGLGASTVPGSENYLPRVIRLKAPGQGINPILTQQPIPKRLNRRSNPELPLAQALAIR